MWTSFTFYSLYGAAVNVGKISCLLSMGLAKDNNYGGGGEDEGPNSILGKHFGKWINDVLHASFQCRLHRCLYLTIHYGFGKGLL